MTKRQGKGRDYDFAVRERAEWFYIYAGRTYAEIEAELGVPEATLKRWGSQGNWRESREKYITSKAQDTIRLIRVKDNLLTELEGEINPGTIHHLLGGYRQASNIINEQVAPPGEAEVDRPALFLEDLRFIVDTLKGIDPSAVAAIARNFDGLVEAFKEEHAKTA